LAGAGVVCFAGLANCANVTRRLAGVLCLAGLANFADVTRGLTGATRWLANGALLARDRFAGLGCDLGRVSRLVGRRRLRGGWVADGDRSGVAVA
jgi:hypothetical protein